MPIADILSKLTGSVISDTVKSVGDTIDKVTTSDDEKLKAKNDLTQIVTDAINQSTSYQRDVLVAELQGNWLQRSWRPILMLAFGFIVVYSKFIAPAFHLPNAVLEDNFWNLMQLGIGGYVVGRSVEKVADTVTKNIDLSVSYTHLTLPTKA